jgi:DnaJ-class molecular chaperone
MQCPNCRGSGYITVMKDFVGFEGQRTLPVKRTCSLCTGDGSVPRGIEYGFLGRVVVCQYCGKKSGAWRARCKHCKRERLF